MSEERIEQATRRIESALGRIADLAERIGDAPEVTSDLAARHENLREAVTNSLKELDDLLEGLEQ
ncbi:hypothetical protein [Allopontixanthobacter sediminis]|uniref:Uncharacterized protein n=1 Tax=Allopontixanthobacter sediminis TaxID=1689985 RepID=A0A845B2D9_9SPHN|nr:hypothetical protein [Allopontixanthobacter sediminis]MXP43792.1 hypothetical protein [Allopontixanthobacter sediminis]